MAIQMTIACTLVMRCRTVQVYGGYTTGTSSVHGRYITGSAGPSPDRAAPGNPCGDTARPFTQYRSARHGAVPVSHPGGGDAPGHWRRDSPDGMARADPATRRGTSKTSQPPSASRTAKTQPTRCAKQSSLRRASRCPTEGQNRRGSAKRAVIRTASFARTLYTICTCTLPCIDP